MYIALSRHRRRRVRECVAWYVHPHGRRPHFMVCDACKTNIMHVCIVYTCIPSSRVVLAPIEPSVYIYLRIVIACANRACHAVVVCSAAI